MEIQDIFLIPREWLRYYNITIFSPATLTYHRTILKADLEGLLRGVKQLLQVQKGVTFGTYGINVKRMYNIWTLEDHS